jgi:DNA-binding transcriptional ArsR family regulator
MVLRVDAVATNGVPAPAVVVTVGAAAADIRRSLGPVAWCALEVLAMSPPEDGTDTWIVSSSVRMLASGMGVAKNTAQRALAVLRGARLVESIQRRSATGEYGSCSYCLNVDADVLSRQPQTSPATSSQAVQSRRVLAKRPVAVKAAVEVGQQLALLPSV